MRVRLSVWLKESQTLRLALCCEEWGDSLSRGWLILATCLLLQRADSFSSDETWRMLFHFFIKFLINTSGRICQKYGNFYPYFQYFLLIFD